MRVSLIAAVARNGVIGRGGELPWKLPADLQHFKKLTMGHHLVVGRKTWDSIGRPLPGRRMVVLSRGEPELAPEVELAADLPSALDLARSRDESECFVGGGEQVYRLALPCADRIYLTEVDVEIEGDAFFPPFDRRLWQAIERRERSRDERHAHDLTWVTWRRRRAA